MALIWWEIALVVGLNAAILAGTLLLFVRFGAPRLLGKAEMWMGGAIGRFMSNLAQQAEEEGVEGAENSGTGQLKLGGFQIDVATIKQLMPIVPQLIELAKMFGLVGSGGGTTTQNPFLK